MRKLVFALLIGALALFVPVAAHAQTYNQVQGTVVAGTTITVTLGPFDPNSLVNGTLNSDPINLGTTRANSAGFATFSAKVPANFSGAHTVTASGTLNGQPKSYTSAPFTVVPASSVLGETVTKGAVARTGASSSTVPMAIGGAAAVAVGAGLVVVAKRRHTAAPAAA